VATPEKPPLRIYADTSVFGGCFDTEFREHSLSFFDRVRRGDVVLLVSRIVREELELAPPHVRALLEGLPRQFQEPVPVDDDVLTLRNAYLAAGVVGARSLEDATHVAAATAARADAIVSWNFKDIVRLDRIRGYNQINLKLGYGILSIVTPRGAIP
jgi:hypothetical protein